jgi:hypothetical protein
VTPSQSRHFLLPVALNPFGADLKLDISVRPSLIPITVPPAVGESIPVLGLSPIPLGRVITDGSGTIILECPLFVVAYRYRRLLIKVQPNDDTSYVLVTVFKILGHGWR